MNPRHYHFIDERFTCSCIYCGAKIDSREHVPSKILLDEPYPKQLPVVGACAECNNQFSLDEQYLACFLECVICGTTNPSYLQRSKIKRILSEDIALKTRIAACQRRDDSGNLLWQPETDRILRIVKKLARGHVAYEINPIFKEPDDIIVTPLLLMSDQERAEFEDVESRTKGLMPEVGSRKFSRALGINPDRLGQVDGWNVVQPRRYRYVVNDTCGLQVQMVLSEYLACLVNWKREY